MDTSTLHLQGQDEATSPFFTVIQAERSALTQQHSETSIHSQMPTMQPPYGMPAQPLMPMHSQPFMFPMQQVPQMQYGSNPMLVAPVFTPTNFSPVTNIQHAQSLTMLPTAEGVFGANRHPLPNSPLSAGQFKSPGQQYNSGRRLSVPSLSFQRSSSPLRTPVNPQLPPQ
jgi:hypothetical protein